MLRLFTDREYGIDSPIILSRAETTRRIFSLELSKHRDVDRVHDGGINSLDIDLIESRYLLSGGSTGGISIHDLENFSGNVKHSYKHVCGVDRSNRYMHKHSIQTVQWYPLDTGIFTSSGTDKLLKVWDTNRLVPADTFEFSTIVYSHHMSPIATKHNLLAVGCQGSTVKLVDLKAGSATHMLKGHKSCVMSVKWSTRDEFILATGSTDNRVLLWDVRAAKGHLMSLDQHNGEAASSVANSTTAHGGRVNGLSFTHDGLFLVTFGTDNRLRLWNTYTGKNCMVNYGSIENDSKKNIQIGLSQGGCPDVIFVPNDGNIDILDLHKGGYINTLRGHYNVVNCCLFNTNSHELFSGGSDRNILVWVPHTDSAYDEHLKDDSKSIQNPSFVKRIAATADTWSSDEDE
ncbi:DNA excision repair protein ERCC-8-like [Haliotis cracherodii]|uniref:DNA excision repair protein ERCC-8-like n=1 Tax=Haliotis cracherodii TaxID=6455 RepID=UPI0039EBF02D